MEFEIFEGNFFLKLLKVFLILVLMVPSFYLYSFGYNNFLKMIGSKKFFYSDFDFEQSQNLRF